MYTVWVSLITHILSCYHHHNRGINILVMSRIFLVFFGDFFVCVVFQECNMKSNLDEFSKAARFKINIQKSVAFQIPAANSPKGKLENKPIYLSTKKNKPSHLQ